MIWRKVLTVDNTQSHSDCHDEHYLLNNDEFTTFHRLPPFAWFGVCSLY